ncbi:MAG: hypothetical protein AAB699_01165 [Patescibacteria group bacterium]
MKFEQIPLEEPREAKEAKKKERQKPKGLVNLAKKTAVLAGAVGMGYLGGMQESAAGELSTFSKKPARELSGRGREFSATNVAKNEFGKKIVLPVDSKRAHGLEMRLREREVEQNRTHRFSKTQGTFQKTSEFSFSLGMKGKRSARARFQGLGHRGRR